MGGKVVSKGVTGVCDTKMPLYVLYLKIVHIQFITFPYIN
ncbi:hypothetical protein VCLMA_B0514 [Vibrio cholerae LMA3984-4]|nr:hypothetical protein VCLMA_B0514 [Vibrio cholerae LMA3984-4]